MVYSRYIMTSAELVALCVLLLVSWNTVWGQDFTVTIIPTYTAPPDFVGGPNDFRAASTVILTCQVEGEAGAETYLWTSSLNAVTGQPNMRSRTTVRSSDSGTHTCTASRTVPSGTGTATFEMNVIGAGIFVNTGDESNNVPVDVLPNNGIVIALDLGTATSGNRLVFQCRSGSTNSSVGDIIGLDGNALPINSSGVTTGGLNIRQQSPATVSVRNRAGNEPALTVAEAGVYTCRIPDESGTIVDVNIGVYETGFNTPPAVSSLTYDPDTRTLTCISTDSTATTVTWTRDGGTLTVDGTPYSMTQTVTDRSASTYENVLTLPTTGDISGMYGCLVGNALGDSNTEIFEVTGQFNFPISGSNTAGEMFTVTCVVTAESLPTAIVWMDPQGGTIVSGDGITLGTVTMEDNSTSFSLQFSPLRTSHGGEYTCQATVESETMSGNVDVNVQVSAPSVTVAQGPVRTLYTEDDLTLTCTIELNAAVDTGVVVTAVWLGPPGTTMLSTGGRITVSDVTGSRPNYQSTLTVTSLEMSDSGAYTCTATASGNGTTFVTESQAGSHTTTVQSIEPFNVTITDSGISTAGQMYTLTCSVDVSGTPSIQWQYSNGSEVTTGDGITVGSQEPSGNTTTLTLTFNPLRTSHGEEYTCQATAETTSVVRTDIWNVIVQISAPTVTITRKPERPLYPGDDANLTCTVDVGGVVDTPVMVAVDITGPGGLMSSGSESLMATETTYQRTVTLTSLSDSTSGDYTCNTIVSPDPPSEFVSGDGQNSNVTTISLEQYDISISATGVPTAGEEYALTCSVNVSAGTPTILWEYSDGNMVATGGDITVGSLETSGTVTTLTLTFNPLLTTRGGEYICRSVVQETVERTAMVDVTVQIPSPSVNLSRDPESGTLRHSDNLTLICTIQLDEAIDTGVDVTVVWNGPAGNISPDNPTPTMVSDTVYESTVTFSSLETSDSGGYTCTATVSPDPSSEFITESGEGTDTLSIIVELAVTFGVEYTPPSDFVGGPNDYRAASGGLTITCQAEGETGSVTYLWTSTCSTGCFISSATEGNQVVGRGSLQSVDSGNHTCTVTDSDGGEMGNATIEINVVGAGIFVEMGDGSVPTGVLPNNGIVISRTGGTRIQFQCRSGSTMTGVGQLVVLSGNTFNTGQNSGVFSVASIGPGSIRIQTSIDLTAADEGVYSCRIPDETGNDVDVNIGVYRNGFNTPPTVSSLTYDPDTRTLTCTSTGSPATTITWTKDGDTLTVDGTTYSMTQTLTVRSASTYENVLTLPATGDISGMYGCQVGNALGDSTTVTFEVTGAQFNFSISGSNTAGGAYTVTCVVTAESSPTAIEWMDSQGGTIVSGDGITLGDVTMEDNTTSSRSLQFSPLRTSHGGEYTCQATVESEITSGSVDVNVQVSISSVMVTQGPVRTLYTEDDLTLTCTIELDEAVDTGVDVTVVWTGPPGDTMLSPDGRITVSEVTGSRPTYQSIVDITSLQMSDSGNYTCNATASPDGIPFVTASQAGAATTTVQFVEPFDVTITDSGMSPAGQMYTLTCSVVVPGTPSIQWQYSNGSEVTSGDGITVSAGVLTFNPLRTSHGGEYTCQATAETTSVVRTAMWDVTVQIPSPSVNLSRDPESGTLRHSGNLTLICTIRLDEAIDTGVDVTVVWNGPAGNISPDNPTPTMVSDTVYESTVTFSSLETSNSGDYTCTATVSPVPSSEFITESEGGTDTLSIIVELAVTFDVDYTPPSGFVGGPNDYRAASRLTITCQGTGGSGMISYLWTSTCSTGCFIHSGTFQNQAVGRSSLISVDSGNHTCTVTDSDGGEMGSATIEIIVVGAGIFVDNGSPAGVLPDNSIVRGGTINFQCRSGSLDTGVGQLVDLDGNTFNIGQNNGVFSVASIGNPVQPGSIRIQTGTDLTAADEGVYTCRIPDETGNDVDVNIGVYLNGFNTAPTISDLEFDAASRTLTCTSTDSPATTVTWTRDGDALTVDGTPYSMTQTVTDRSASTYENVLTIGSEVTNIVGNYTCTVSNALGSDSRSEITSGVNIEGDRPPLTVGENATIICTSDVTDTTSMEWLYNGEVVVDSTGQQANLTFDPVEDDIHNRVYTCRANASDVSFTSSINITVQVPLPALGVSIGAQGNLLAGDVYSLTCTATELIDGLTNSPTLQWLNGTGQPFTNGMLGDTMSTNTSVTQTLTFSSLLTSDGGEYTCEAMLQSPAVEEGIMNSTTETVTVQISISSVMVDQAPVRTLYTEDDLTLTCTIELDEAVDTGVDVTVEWIGPNRTLSGTVPSAISNTTYQSIINITSLEISDTGFYTCNATASPDGTTFVTASEPTSYTTDVAVGPFNVTITDSGISTAGQMYTLTCSVDVPGTPSIQWQDSNGSDVTSGDGITVSAGVLTFNPLLTSHGGGYTCQATAEMTSVIRTAMWNVTVQISAPTVTITRTPERPLYPGEDVNLTCTVDVGGVVDTPVMVAVDITGPGSLMSSGSEPLMATERTYQRTVTLTSLSDSTSGDYTCDTTVSPGPPSEFVTGDGQNSDMVTISLEQYDISISATDAPTAGEEYNLTCSVNVSDGSPSIQWQYSNGSNVTTGGDITVGSPETSGSITTLTLTFNPLQTSHGGEYICRSVVQETVERTAMEDVTVQISISSVTVTQAPDRTLYTEDDLTLTCTIELDEAVDTGVVVTVEWTGPNGMLFGTVPSVASSTTYQSVVNITSLEMSDTGPYTCNAAASPNGTPFVTASEPTSNTTEVTVESFNVTISASGISTAGQMYALTCSVDVPGTSSIQWQDSNGSEVTSGDGITVSVGVLTFNPLRTSHGGGYTCQATAETTSVVRTAMWNVTVQISAPTVTITRTPQRPLYPGDDANLTCTVDVGGVVDTPVMVAVDITGPGSLMSSGSESFMTTETTYRRTVTLTSLNDSTSGDYTCNTTVSPGPSSEFVSGVGQNSNVITISLEQYDISISTTGVPTSGEEYNLTCSVNVSAGTPSIQWEYRNGSNVTTGGDITVVSQETSGTTVTTLTLTFNPLQTSHGGEYICRSVVQETVERTAMVDVTVQISISSVMVAQAPDRTLYTEDDLTLTCTIELDEAVDTGVDVTVVWTGPPGTTELSTGGRITVSDVTGSRPTYQSTVNITSLEISDTSFYTCNATASPDGTPFATASEATSNTTGVAVELFDVTITVTSGMSTAGQMYTLTCSVDVPGTPSIQWQYSNGSDVTIGDGITVSEGVLTFNPLRTSHGGGYTCQATAGMTGVIRTAMQDVTVQIPSPSVTLSRDPESGTLRHGDNLTLTCTIQLDGAIDTGIVVTVVLTGPPGNISPDNPTPTMDSNTVYESTVTFSSLETSDSGDYTCTATVSPVPSSEFITESEGETDTLNIIVELAVTFGVDYTPPSGFVGGPNDYRAASGALTITCQATGGSGMISYLWTSTCSTGCFIHSGTFQNQDVGRSSLISVDSGNHTCTVTDSDGGEMGSATIEINVVGAGIFVDNGAPAGVLPNNSIVRGGTIIFQCRSGSLDTGVGQLVDLDGNTFNIGQNNGVFSVASIGNPVQPGSISTSLTAADEGVYSCRIPDETGNEVDVNIGVYRNGFNTPPDVTNLEFSAAMLALTCTSTDSPATTVTWVRDGDTLTVDGTTYSMTQTVTDRRTSTYENVLTISSDSTNIVGDYTCTVRNTLGSDSMDFTVRGVVISGPALPLTVGTSATFTCTSDLTATNIEWVYFEVVAVDTTGEEVDLTFDPVNDSLHERVYTCRATIEGNPFTDSVTVTVELPPQVITVSIEVQGSSVAGDEYSITCTVMEDIAGLTNSPTLRWVDPDGNIVNGEVVTVNETTDMSATQTLTFGPLRTSDGGNYSCQAMLVSPPGDIEDSAIQTVTVQIPTPSVNVTVPDGTLYAGTNVTLNCTIQLDGAIDTVVDVTVLWTGPPGGTVLSTTGERITVSDVTGSRPSYQSTVNITPLISNDNGAYTCEATVSPNPTSEFITMSGAGSDSGTVTVEALPAPVVAITTEGSPTAGERYTLICTVGVVKDLFSLPEVTWLGPPGTVESEPERSGSETTLNLTFNPLQTSHGEDYICNANVTVAVADIEIFTNATETVIVTIPPPSVTFTGSPSEDPLYAGVRFTLTCDIELNNNVNTAVDVSATWGRSGDVLANGTDGRITFTGTTESGSSYQTEIVFDPLSNDGDEDNGDYTCTAVVTPSSTQYITGVSSTGTRPIDVRDVPAPVVTVTGEPAGTAPSAGESYTLTCTVEVVEGLVVTPDVKWLDPDNNVVATGGSITVGSPETSGNTTTLTLTFNPLQTSHGGEYTCRAKITIEDISVDVTSSDSFNVIVQIPPPDVSITRDPLGTLYAGTTLTFTCTIELDEQVDTGVMVTADWTGPDGSMLNNARISITAASLTGPLMYESRVMFDPLSDGPEDGGTYTCMATVSPVEKEEYILTGSNNTTISIEITDLPSPEVEITAPGGTPSAGESYTLTCTVEVVEGLIVTPDVEWLDLDNNVTTGGDITVGSPQPSGTTTTLTLTFNPLRTSHGGEYTCRANITIDEISIIDLSNTSSTDVIVQIPPPIVTTITDQTPYNGSVFTITCNIELDSAVDTDVTVTGTWSRMGQQLSTDTATTCITVSDTDSSYQTTLTFDPLGVVSSHDGSYICEATVVPNPPTAFILEIASQSDGYDLMVQALPSPETVFTLTGELALGQSYTITCSVEVAGGLRDPADATRVIWTDPDDVIVGGGGGDVSVEDPVTTGDRTDVILTFTSFQEDQGGVYTCAGCVSVNSCNGDPFIVDHCDDTSVCITSGTPRQFEEGDPVCTSVSDETLELSWNEPSVTECSGFGIVSYEVEVQKYTSTEDGVLDVERLNGPETFSPTSQPLAFTSRMTQVDGLENFVPYEVCISAATVAGTGDSRSCQDCFTREGSPSIAPRNVTVDRTSIPTITVSWTPLNLVEARGFIRSYTVFYDPITNRKRQPSGGMKTVLGNESSTTIDGLENRDYNVSVLTNTDVGGGPRSPAVGAPVPSQEGGGGGGGGNVGAVVGAVVGILMAVLVIVIVLVVAFFVYRSRRRGGVTIKTKEMYELTEKGKPQETASLRPLVKEKPEVDEEKNEKEAVEEQPQPIPVPSIEVTDRMKPISMVSFRDHVQKMHFDRDKGFEIEYQSLGSEPIASHGIARRSYNRPKNRFANIFPYDFSRVTLSETPEVEGSDYINACFMDGYNRKKAYIAAQGPLPNTVGEFWRMVWEYKLANIVMLTKCLEAGRRKCEQYWGENIGDDYETVDKSITITTTSVMPFADFEIRMFNVKKADCEPLRVTHYHFTSWPDHGVPKFATSLISFIRRVQRGHNKDDGFPLLVHCSAGVGRTGTFILLDSMLERMKMEDSVNVYEFLHNMRAKRVLMVQTLPQYVFIHDALDELITCGETDVAASTLRVKVNRLQKVIPGKGITGFAEQFQLLDQVSRKPEEGDCSDAQEYYNREKNRYPDKLPYNMSRARLRPTGEDGSEYINASFIDGYKRRNAYIATQAPLQATVNDFWRMIWEFKSKVIVMLCNMMEDGQDASYPYWPIKEAETQKFGKILVTLQSKAAYGDFSVRRFNIQEEKAQGSSPSDGFVVTQFHHTEWPEHGRAPSTANLIEMMDMITKSQMSSGNRSITVMCNDGMGRTGTFICIHAQLERLKTEGVVDFFQYIKSARIHRAELVPEVDQFAYCHEVLADFVDTFDNYANFKDVI